VIALTSPASVLIADPFPADRQRLVPCLERAGFAVSEAASARALLSQLLQGLPHVIMLDLQLPGMAPAELCRRIKRRADIPILVFTALDDDDVRVAALNAFADDYIVKPGKLPEIVARIRCLLRRTWYQYLAPDSSLHIDEHVSLDFARREVSSRDRAYRLTPLESRLLQMLVINAGQVLPNDLLRQRLWGDSEGSAGSLWEHVRRLRRKLGDNPDCPRYIFNEPGLGYRFARLLPRPFPLDPSLSPDNVTDPNTITDKETIGVPEHHGCRRQLGVV